MSIEMVPCSKEHIEKLIESSDAFSAAYGLQVIEGYLPFEGALQYTLNQLQTAQVWHPWLTYLFVFKPDAAVVGIGGFKSVPDADRTVEIGYAIAPSYQNKGFATAAVRQLIDIAFASREVDCVCAHTLAATSASTRVLQKCGLTNVLEFTDPDDGPLWRWETDQPNHL